MGAQPPKSTAAHALGSYLKEVRKKSDLALRDVEDATDISNAYLSQLENGKVTKPSPHILHALATLYRVPYETLMERAGYVTVKKTSEQTSAIHQSGQLPASSFEGITEEEEVHLLGYLNFIRSQAKKTDGKT
jgi:HTH-type transcriptional regulator, competence development regulator